MMKKAADWQGFAHVPADYQGASGYAMEKAISRKGFAFVRRITMGGKALKRSFTATLLYFSEYGKRVLDRVILYNAMLCC